MNNGQRVKIGLSIGIVFFAVATGYAEVKFRSINNEKNLIELKQETREDLKEIKMDIRDLLVQTTEVLTQVKDLKRSN